MRTLMSAIGLLLCFGEVQAQEPAAFWRGKTITIVVGGSTGGGFDAYARLMSRHMGRHIPGNPAIVVTAMPGAAGNMAADWISNVAPKDGTVIGAPISTQPLAPILEEPGTLRYDVAKLNYLGSAAQDVFLCVERADGPLKTFADAFTFSALMGGFSETSQTGYLPVLLNNTIGTKFRVVYGYNGSREVTLAMARGEVDGLCGMGWASLRAGHAADMREGRLVLLVQEHFTGLPELNERGVPRATDFAKTDAARRILEIVYAQELFGRPYFVAAGVPGERVEALRDAMMASWRDPELLADAQRLDLDISPMSGSDMQALLSRIYASPEELKQRVREAIRPPK